MQLRTLACFTFGAALMAQLPVPPMPPESKAETPAMREAASLAASTARAPKAWLTAAERSGFTETGTYGECIRFYRELERRSRWARLVKIGETAEGRPLYVLVVSADRAFTPAAGRRTGKAVVLLQNGIHAGENGGKDAAMMLLRDLLVAGQYQDWLRKVILISIPVFNADGHERISAYNRINENGPREMGFRVTAQRLNLNRDYMKADAPEMRAWLRLYNAWLPDLLIDNHVTDGSDSQYDITIATHTEQDIAAAPGAWVKQQYLPLLFREMERHGHVMGWYTEGGGAVLTASPRYSTGYAAAQNRAALLVETHSLKSFKTRTWAHYDVMRVSIDAVARHSAELVAASREADRAMAAWQPGTPVFLAGDSDGAGEAYTQRLLEPERVYSEAARGEVLRYTSKARDVPARIVRTLRPRLAPRAPAGYVISRAWPQVIEVLRLHGVAMRPLSQPLAGEFPSLYFEDVRFAQQPFEGRFPVSAFRIRESRERRRFEAGSVFVPVNQRAGKVAMHFLEPEAPDSALRWGFFPTIFEQKEYFSDYVFAPYADEMLKRDEALRARFQRDAPGQGRAALRWLYERSPYFEPDKNLYPVVRLEKEP